MVLTNSLQLKTITAAGIAERENYESAGREIINGAWAEETKMAGERHNQITLNLTLILAPFIKKYQLGRFYGDNLNFVLEGNPQNIITMRIPDMAFVKADRLQPLQEGYLYLAPDLAIEVVSPTETKRDTQEKIEDYLRFGTQEIWVIDPHEEKIMVHSPHKATMTYQIGDTLTSPLFPNLVLPIAQIFEV